jgi:hypothetical protein
MRTAAETIRNSQNDSKMKRVFLVASIMGLILVFVGASFAREYLVMDYISNVMAIWNDKSLYVVVQKTRSILTTTPARHLLSQLAGVVYPIPQDFRTDTIVFNFDSHGMQQVEHPNTGPFGLIFPYNGNLHLMRGETLKNYPGLFSISNNVLGRVPKEEALIIVDKLGIASEYLKAQGWKLIYLYPREGLSRARVELMGKSMTLLSSCSFRDRVCQIEIVDDRTNRREVLCHVSMKVRSASDGDLVQLRTFEASRIDK